MIGDSPVDIKAAKAAGCSSIGVAYHDEIRDALVDSNPDKIVGSLQELVQS
jgi:phosphoglycolate phosphatase-like HAD superfamily hydrolase